jgi:hypothetical protein
VHVAGVGIHMLYEAICIQRLAILQEEHAGLERSGVQELTPEENSLNTEQQRGGGQ